MPGQKPQVLGSVALLTARSRARLVLAGDIDSTVSTDMAEALGEAERLRVPVEVDTRSVTFMDSAAIAQLARLVHHLADRRVTFIEPADVVRFLLEVTSLGAAVDIIDNDPGFPDDDPPPTAA